MALHYDLFAPIVDAEAARFFLRRLHELDLSFHLDDDPATVVRAASGAPVFGPEEARWIAGQVDKCFVYLPDPHAELGRIAFPDGEWGDAA